MPYCIYLRKSRADEELERSGEGDTLSRHRKALLELARRQHLDISKIYEEVVSGESITSRPQMQSLLSDVENGMYNGVLVMEVERLARGDTMDQGLVSQTFKYSNTKIITPIKTYDPNNEFDEEYFEFGLFMSRREYKAINRRLQRGRLASAKEGKYLGSRAPYGYERVKIENDKGCTLKIIPEQAEVVRLIFNLYVHGEADEFGQMRRMGIQQIARHLNELGIPASRHDYWEKATIRDMLNNPVYAGRIRWGWRKTVKKVSGGQTVKSRPWTYDDNCIIVDGLHEAIVPPELFDEAQTLSETRPVMPVGYKKEIKNPMAGFIFCRKCGKRMSMRKHTTPGKPDYLVCHSRYCKNVSTPIDLVEKRLLDTLRKWVQDYEVQWQNHEESLSSDKNDLLTNAKNAQEKELATLRKQLDATYDLLEQGIYSTEQFTERSTSITHRIEEAKAKIETLTIEIANANAENRLVHDFIPKVKQLLAVYDTVTSAGEKNAMLKEIVEKAVYNKDKSGAFKGVSTDDFELEVSPRLPKVKLR